MKTQASLALLAVASLFGQDAWTERMSRANQLQRQGNYQEARKLYTSAVADAENSNTNGLQRAQAFNNLAAHFYESGAYSEAEPLYRKAAAEWRTLGQTGQFGITYSNLATLYRKTGRYKLALDTFADASQSIRAAYGSESPEFVSCLINLSEVYRATGQLRDAEATTSKALQISNKLFKEDDPRLSHSLHAHAIVLQSLNRGSEALPLHQRALAIRESSYGSTHPYVAATLTALVSIHLEQARYTEAEPLAQRALAIWETKLGPDHLNTAVALNNLAQVYRFEQRFAEAEPLYRRAIDVLEKLKSPEALKPISNLADFYLSRGRTTAALALYKRSEEIARISFGESDPQTSAAQLKIAQAFQALGRQTEAAQVYRKIRQARPSQSFQATP